MIAIEDATSTQCKRRNVQIFDLLPGPRCPAQKFQRRFHRGIILETIDADSIGELLPPVVIDKLLDDSLQGDTVHGVAWLFSVHIHP